MVGFCFCLRPLARRRVLAILRAARRFFLGARVGAWSVIADRQGAAGHVIPSLSVHDRNSIVATGAGGGANAVRSSKRSADRHCLSRGSVRSARLLELGLRQRLQLRAQRVDRRLGKPGNLRVRQRPVAESVERRHRSSDQRGKVLARSSAEVARQGR